MSYNEPVQFEDALKYTGFGKFNILLLVVSGIGLSAVNFESYSIGYILPAAQCDFQLDNFHKGILTSANFVGVILSSPLWGYLADTKGRKNIIIIALLLTFFCTFLSTFITNFWLFTTLRFLSGFFICGPSAIIFAYLGEFQSEKYRTVIVTAVSIFNSASAIGLPGLSWAIIPQQWNLTIFNTEYKPWRLLLLICGIPSVIVSLAFFALPESPKFLLLQKKGFLALKILRKVYASNTGNKKENYPVQEFLEEEKNSTSNDSLWKLIWDQTASLFYKSYILNTFVVCTLQFGLFAVSSGLLLWYPYIINQLANNDDVTTQNELTVCNIISNANFNSNNEEISCTDTVDNSVFEQSIIMGLVYTVGYFVITIAVKLIGKRTVLVIFLSISGILGILLCWVTNKILIYMFFIGFLTMSGLCVSVVCAAVVQLFPTRLRAMAMCISLMFGRIGSVAASSTVGILLDLNCFATFIAFSIITLVCAGLSFIIPNHDTTEIKETVTKQ